MAKLQLKISVVREILEQKETLFGQFSDKLTKMMKIDAWKNIAHKSQALGLVPTDKDYTFVRDVFWANIKRSTLAKKDNSKQTGEAGVRSRKFNELDDIVLEIIGKESPLVQGIRQNPVEEDSGFNNVVAPDNEWFRKVSRSNIGNNKLTRKLNFSCVSLKRSLNSYEVLIYPY